MVVKSARQVRELMAQWRKDPHWDVEDTEGFERYRGLLARFRRAHDHIDIIAGEARRVARESAKLRHSLDALERRHTRLAEVQRRLADDAAALVPQGDGPVEPEPEAEPTF